MIKPITQKIVPLCLGVAILSGALALAVIAWNEPGSTPPNGNIAAPINTGGTLQVKSGDLKIGNGLKISYDGQSFALKKDDGTIRLVVGQDGNVGIGTTGPAQKLDVAGNIKANQFCLGGRCCSTWEECVNLFNSGEILSHCATFKTTGSAECKSGNCSYGNNCCPAGSCGWGENPGRCVASGGWENNVWFGGYCVNGKWRTATGYPGCGPNFNFACYDTTASCVNSVCTGGNGFAGSNGTGGTLSYCKYTSQNNRANWACLSGNCSYGNHCCPAGSCGWGTDPGQCIENGGWASNIWFTGWCVNGKWCTNQNGTGCI